MHGQPSIRMILAAMLCAVLTGCAPLLVGAGATGGYKVATEERSAGTVIDDSTISNRVWQAFASEPGVNQYKIDIDTVLGRVTLNGMVTTTEESQLAENLARQVEGVKEVRNNLQVGGQTFSRKINDKLLVGMIKSKLIVTPDVRALNIDVDAVHGVVTLTGIVTSDSQRTAVLNAAQGIAGVEKIVDNLTLTAK